MARSPLFLCFLLGLSVFRASADGLGGADRIAETAGSGLAVSSEPGGAEVYVNDVFRGSAPLSLPELLPGAQRLRLEKDGYRTREAIVVLPRDGGLSVFLKLEEAEGILRVNAEPAGGNADGFVPEATIDGRPAELGDNTVSEGFHAVRVRAFGYEAAAATVFVSGGTRETADFALEPAAFRVDSFQASRRRFNPRNPGRLGGTTISIELSAPGSASVTVRPADGGAPVFAAELPSFPERRRTVEWRGADAGGTPIPDGEYLLELRARAADGSGETERTLRARIDSDMDIRPRTLSAGGAGLLFAPAAACLPAGAFQAETVAVFGRPYGAADDFAAPPVSLGLRWAPLDRTEASAAAAVESGAADGTRLSVSAAVKRALLGGGADDAVSLAAGLSWTYAAEGSAAAFGPQPAADLSLAAELRFARFGGVAAALLCAPALSWDGAEGMPEDAVPAPALGVGLALEGRAFSAGLSARGGPAPLFFAAEARFYPPPSLLVFSVFCGGWTDGGASGAFGGAGLGIVY